MMDWKDIKLAPQRKGAEFLVKREDGRIGIALFLAKDRMLVKCHADTPSPIVSYAPLPL